MLLWHYICYSDTPEQLSVMLWSGTKAANVHCAQPSCHCGEMLNSTVKSFNCTGKTSNNSATFRLTCQKYFHWTCLFVRYINTGKTMPVLFDIAMFDMSRLSCTALYELDYKLGIQPTRDCNKIVNTNIRRFAYLIHIRAATKSLCNTVSSLLSK